MCAQVARMEVFSYASKNDPPPNGVYPSKLGEFSGVFAGATGVEVGVH